MNTNINKTLIIVFILIISLCSIAHEDYLGDIYPRVIISDSFFIVKYTNLSFDSGGSNLRHRYYFNKYSFQGEIVEQKAKREKDTSNHIPQINLPLCSTVWYGACSWKTDSIIYTTYECRETNYRKPSIFSINTRNNQILCHVFLQWGIRKVQIHDLAVIGDKLFVIATPHNILPYIMPSFLPFSWSEITRKLYLYVFDLSTGKLIGKTYIGKPTYIYSFAQVSSLNSFSVFNDNLYFAWISKDLELYLTHCETISGKVQTSKIATIDEWNTKPSIAINGNNCFIAYHTLSDTTNWKSSVIKTLLINLNKHAE